MTKHNINPSARLITTIGEDLIKDVIAAIVELVKNAYDADADNVKINFSSYKKSRTEEAFIRIEIIDDGHGMSYETVTEKWLVPATDDKLKRGFSPKGRPLQGRKGIGRYSVALLGEKLKLETIDKNNNKTVLNIDWENIKEHRFLSEVFFDVETFNIDKESMTKLTIIGSQEKLCNWTSREIKLLINELRKMISPIDVKEGKNEFKIEVNFIDFENDDYKNKKILIEPLPLIELFDYRLYGTIDESGYFDLTFEQKILKEFKNEIITKNFYVPKDQQVGEIYIDIRVFDRDPDSISDLIARGLYVKDTGDYMGKREARSLLTSMSGIGIYRGDFRIRPYGDTGYDWLELDKKRVQNPSKKIGSDQVIGFVDIKREEISNLEEKSARDGLKENKYYNSMKNLLESAIHELEIRRVNIRKLSGRGRKKSGLQKDVRELFKLDEITSEIEKVLRKTNVDSDNINHIKDFIRKKEIEKSKELEKIEEIIAVYQGQATLGKIVKVVLHEGRKPLNWFRNQSKVIKNYADEFKENKNEEDLDKIVEKSYKSRTQAEKLNNLFKRLTPLAINRKKNKYKFDMNKVIEDSKEVFIEEIERNGVNVNIELNGEFNEFTGYENDFYIIFTNLFENSIYWVSKSEINNKKIDINIVFNDKLLEYIDFKDNGIGVSKKFIESQVIFEPDFSTKENNEGTGLGLALAGEAAVRNDCELKAIYCDDGAYFRLLYNAMEE